jgi:hypothetical protein
VIDWDWSAVVRTSRRLNRFIRSRAVATVGSRLVLSAAGEALERGDIVLKAL